jgi:crotonobetainyl-CoA:carnitine CoA-transferase CaiB-like acyl-CoA transferase
MDPISACDSHSIPEESKSVFESGILKNPLHGSLPKEIRELGKYVTFKGSLKPSIAINWRFAESVAALKALEATLINALISRKYGVEPQKVTINTDHAQLFFLSALFVEVNPDPTAPVKPTTLRELTTKYANYFPNGDIYQMASSFFRRATTNIYKTKDGRFFHVHGSMNPDPSLKAIGFQWDRPEITTHEQSWQPFMEKIAEKTAEEWDQILGEDARQAATICLDPEEYAKHPHGQANEHVGLYRVRRKEGSDQAPGWWKESSLTSVHRPLAGLKILDLTRVIAAPAIGRSLAELGASVMRVTASHLPDFTGLQPDLNWGKWNCHLDLRKEEDKEKLQNLILDADVVINGYRPGVLDKYGAGAEQVFQSCSNRKRGVIYVRKNCFGWDGPWAYRSGWQPISDANCGIATGFARAMGHDEAVIPVFPNSDYCTGIAGSCAVLQAIIEQAESGGSYLVDTSLNYYSRWLAKNVGEYPQEVWNDVWERNGRQVFRHWHSMNYTMPRYLDMIVKNKTLTNPDFFEERTSGALGGLKFRVVKPILQFPVDTVELGFNVGTRGNGVDAAHWPKDLMTEVVV